VVQREGGAKKEYEGPDYNSHGRRDETRKMFMGIRGKTMGSGSAHHEGFCKMVEE